MNAHKIRLNGISNDIFKTFQERKPRRRIYDLKSIDRQFLFVFSISKHSFICQLDFVPKGEEEILFKLKNGRILRTHKKTQKVVKTGKILTWVCWGDVLAGQNIYP